MALKTSGLGLGLGLDTVGLVNITGSNTNIPTPVIRFTSARSLDQSRV